MDYCGYFGQNGLTEGVPFHLNGNFAAGYSTTSATGAPTTNVYGNYANPYLTTSRYEHWRALFVQILVSL